MPRRPGAVRPGDAYEPFADLTEAGNLARRAATRVIRDLDETDEDYGAPPAAPAAYLLDVATAASVARDRLSMAVMQATVQAVTDHTAGLREAARAAGVAPETIRRWCREAADAQQAPTVPGGGSNDPQP